MCGSLRYCVSHCLYAAMTRLEEANREVNMHSSVRYLGCLARINLLAAIFVGLYVRWEKTADALILVIFILGLFVLGIASILYYYFSMETASLSLSNLWFGFLLGLLCFLNNSAFKNDVKEEATNNLLLSAIVLRVLCSLVERICGCIHHRPTLLTTAEFLELVGFAIASTIMLVEKSMSIILLVMALAMLIIDLRMKSFLAIPNLAIFGAIASLLFFPSLRIPTNPFALACFFSCLISDPLLDVYFSGLSVTERWKPYLYRGKICRRLSVISIGVVELIFFILAAFKLRYLDLWYFVIPGFSVFGIFWMICHVIFFITLWGFHTKLNDCHKVYYTHCAENNSLDRVMASKGMRHFCLISKQLVFFSLLATAVLGAVSWQPTNGIFMSAFLIVLPLESMAHGLFHELGNCLGGTCVGYAVVIPTNFCSPDGQPTLLPPDHVQELNLRSTGMLNAIQRFFAYHMIETYGCDYSTSGLSFDTLHSKIKSFLELRTADGPRHDTYILYYSGHSHGSGEWALAGGDALRLDTLLEWWREKNGTFCSRLIIVLDCENSQPWVKEVRKVNDQYVAVQGAEMARIVDVEEADPPQLGDFTRQWVEYNCNPNSNISWSEKGRTVKAVYGVSKRWSDYTLHLPTGSDVAKHWMIYFPRVTYPLVHLANWFCGLNMFWVCKACFRCLKRLKMIWFLPTVLDTGQGFKLVKS
ncbi:transmembrane protein 168 [Gallus gallus]|uniref:Transmembrane protein 168 n=1 Tax=Gallus gallus TaxID=9031 RepID=A0A8V0X8Q5_CHICK|nr:transmembrane protein 168 [Gallus gallus]XP_040507680.1 transmembrane protein 168 [Gallus gallus]XP_040515326.1 transmembrane protein 168 [Gallus gallus]XP_040515327.1 transmembrane protein 168 [Gallus gallus]XP_040515328.1 transmembrane protein 168 [Gallus gallus]XP_046756490.1 transmembrane protein 168 [Gallus gallus]XP_046764842.1 transmembrane protein 168 [Gallus gallus]XP_416021.3 transmembrane protein 168 [Gallus gallus]